MTQLIVILRHNADANVEDIETLKAAGLLVLRVSDPADVSVISAQSLIATDLVFRSLIEMYRSMEKGYGDNDHNRVKFANTLVGYVRDAMSPTTDTTTTEPGR